MTTLIVVYDGSGRRVGRCDASCYEATTPVCRCVCGGRNHGKGRQQAIDNTRQLAEQMVCDYARSLGLDEYRGEVSDDVYQLPLPLEV